MDAAIATLKNRLCTITNLNPLTGRIMGQFSQDTQKILDTLTQVAIETLERKRRLGHYAVIWQNGEPVAIGEDVPERLIRPVSKPQ